MRLHRIILLVGVLAFMAVIAGAILYYRASYTAHLEHELAFSRARLQRVNDYISQQADHYSRVTASLTVTTKSTAYLEYPSDSLEHALTAQFRHLADVLDASAIYLMDADGMTVIASNANAPRSFVGHNFSFRPYFKQAIGGGIGRQLALGTVSDEIGAYYSLPVPSRQAPAGVVVIKAPLRLPWTLNSPNSDGHAHADGEDTFLVVSPEGLVAATNRMDWKQRELPPALLHKTDGTVAVLGSKYNIHSVDVDAFDGWQLIRLTPSDHWLSHYLQAMVTPTGVIYFFLLASLAAVMASLYQVANTEVRRRELANRRLRASRLRYRELSMRDPLTGLFNRSRYYRDLAVLVERSRSENAPFSMALLDLDHFKEINDTYGHQQGDEILKLTAETLQQGLRQNDTAYRIGGEEFLLLLPQTPPEEARQLARMLRSKLRVHQLHARNGKPLRISFSCAITPYQPGESEDDFFRRADDLLYRAKAAGRDKILVAA